MINNKSAVKDDSLLIKKLAIIYFVLSPPTNYSDCGLSFGYYF